MGGRENKEKNKPCITQSIVRLNIFYTVAGKAIGFAPEQPLQVVAFACSASGISKQLEYNMRLVGNGFDFAAFLSQKSC
jgi:hypothetical protein